MGHDVNREAFSNGENAQITEPDSSEFMVLEDIPSREVLFEAMRTHHVIIRQQCPSQSFSEALRGVGHPLSKEVLTKGARCIPSMSS